ncbi:hypothetical protein LDENG_00218280 [Lucifuga dentata]|nr:hypothetical protein LDENG_00218280 [Lucifuga dentata]
MRLLAVDKQDILTVAENECREFKPAILQPCNQVDCPPTWESEPWQQCSQSCGGGVQVRKVYCKQLLSTGAYRRLGGGACRGVKPTTNRSLFRVLWFGDPAQRATVSPADSHRPHGDAGQGVVFRTTLPTTHTNLPHDGLP